MLLRFDWSLNIRTLNGGNGYIALARFYAIVDAVPLLPVRWLKIC